MIVVAARGLVKTYGSGRAARRVLDGADLEVARRRARRGRRALGLGQVDAAAPARRRSTAPEAGAIEVAGERVDGASERELDALRRRRVGFVFQSFHLVPELTGEENVLLAARLPGAPPGAPRARGAR